MILTQAAKDVQIDCGEIDVLLRKFLDEYNLTETPIEVSFRALLPNLKNIDRFTHLIHSYPAKLLLHIPYFFLNSNIFSQPGDTTLDPFCGTGTVLLESLLAGRNSVGADANPLARLIASVKTCSFSEERLTQILNNILQINTLGDSGQEFPDVVNIDFWFNAGTKKSLNDLRNAIAKIEDIEERNFFLVCFSNLIKKVSYADPRVSVPVKLNQNRFKENSSNYLKTLKRIVELNNIDVNSKFKDIVKDNIERFRLLSVYKDASSFTSSSTVISNDARKLTQSLNSTESIHDESIDLILTSPPYAGAQKYIRSSSLNLGWLSLASQGELRLLDKCNIGRESFSNSSVEIPVTNIAEADTLIEEIKQINIVRAKIVATYLIEMQQALTESLRVLKKSGYLILVIGNNKVCNKEFNTQHYLTEFLKSKGLTLVLKLIDDIKSYGLMTKRNKTADIISREWVLIFKK